MAMEDALTDFPPPSRFFFDDLNNFTPSQTLTLTLPPPFPLFSNPNSLPLKPNLLIISLSRPSHFLLLQIPNKTLAGTLILPELPATGNSLHPSLNHNSCLIYTLDSSPSTILVSIHYSIPSERSSIFAKLLFDQIKPEKMLVLSSIQSLNFRGKLSPDEFLAFKLETSKQRLDVDDLLVKNLDYFPSGSMIDGVSAAIMAQCQIRKMKGTLVVCWPDYDSSVVSFFISVLEKVCPGLDCRFDLESCPYRENRADSELYT